MVSNNCFFSNTVIYLINNIFKTVPILLSSLILVILSSLIVIIAQEILKLFIKLDY